MMHAEPRTMRPSRRHILFITGEYPPLAGGVGAYTEKLAYALTDLGWKASVLTTSRLKEREIAAPIDVLPAMNNWNWRLWYAVPDIAQRIQADWLHVQYQTAAFDMNPSINIAPGKWQRDGYRVAWTYHDLLVPYLFPKAGDRLRRFVTRRPAKTADLTVVTNEGDRRQLEDFARTLAKIPIGSNIPVTEVTSSQRKHVRDQLGYTDADFVIAYFGFLNRSKGGLTLVRTLELVRSELPHARLLMIGERVGASDPTNYAYLHEVESLIKELDLTSAVQWTGLLDDRQVSHALSAADVLFMPYEDGASLRRGTLMAGLAHGCAVVTTQPQAPCPELVDGQDLLFVPPAHPQAAASEILRIAGNAKLASRLRAGAKISSRQFTWQEIARQHAGLYDSLAL
jgi:glycosyltransferase involved in cell wall biosynthesis